MYNTILVVGTELISYGLDYTDRSTCVLFGDASAATVFQASDDPAGILTFELGSDGDKGMALWVPGGGSINPMSHAVIDRGENYIKMNGREVFKFATRVMVSSATAVLDECGKSIADVDVYVPHQANKRIIDHAVGKLGVPRERTVVNVDRYGNTSSGSIPLALADARAEGRLHDGALVLMTGMGAGLTWGSALLEWTSPSGAAARG